MSLSDVRGDVVDALGAASITAYDYAVESYVPPAAIVLPDSPYVTTSEDDVFGVFDVNIQVILIGGRGTNSAAADGLDDLIETAVAALDDWNVNEISSPSQINHPNGGTYLGVVLSITTQFKF